MGQEVGGFKVVGQRRETVNLLIKWTLLAMYRSVPACLQFWQRSVPNNAQRSNSEVFHVQVPIRNARGSTLPGVNLMTVPMLFNMTDLNNSSFTRMRSEPCVVEVRLKRDKVVHPKNNDLSPQKFGY